MSEPYTGSIEDGTHHFAVRVYYEDTDAGGVVYHANYLRFMERARTDMLSHCGVHLGAALAAGEGTYVVATMDLRFRAPARLGDALTISSRMTELRGSSSVIHQAVSRDRLELVTANVTVAFVGADGRPRRQPAAWTQAFRAVTGAC